MAENCFMVYTEAPANRDLMQYVQRSFLACNYAPKRAPKFKLQSSFLRSQFAHCSITNGRMNCRGFCGALIHNATPESHAVKDPREGSLSSWDEKADSTSTGAGCNLVGADGSVKMPANHGECKSTSTSAWRSRILDKEGNIDNIEQQSNHGSCEEIEDTSSKVRHRKVGYNNLNHSDNLGSTNPTTFKTYSQAMAEVPRSGTMDWRAMAEGGLSSKPWPCEGAVEVGEMGESIMVKEAMVLPSSQGKKSGLEPQEGDELGGSESSCDEGFVFRDSKDGMGRGVQLDKLQEWEQEVLQEDDGRTPDDYHRRADFFGKSAEAFVAEKKRGEGNPHEEAH